MKIELLPSDYVINARKDIVDSGDKIESNFLIRAVKITNSLDATVNIKKLQFDLKVGEQTIKTISYPAAIIDERALEFRKTIEMFARNPQNELSYYGHTQFWDLEKYTISTLEPRWQTGVFLEHFVVSYKECIDQVLVTVVYDCNDIEESQSVAIAVKEYDSKNKYRFPLEGKFLVVNNWNNLYGHRLTGNQEFAIDVVALDDDAALPLEEENAYYNFYGMDVLAVCAGEVVGIFNEYPENLKAGELLPRDRMRELYQKYGYDAVVAGNYVVIKHDGDEYSFYAHLVPGSIPVKNGDIVKQGDVIGRLGNSGNSDLPHLHFHVMNGKELSSRGLPCKFANLVDITGEKISFIDQDFCLVKTN